MKRTGLHLAWVAALACITAIVLAAASTDGYASMQHPVGLLGSDFSPHHDWFNPLGFVLPGLLVALFALALERVLHPSGHVLRIGFGMLLLAALAFAAQGLFPLDLGDLDAGSSRRHAVANAVFLLGGGGAGLLLGLALLPRAALRPAAVLGLLLAAGVAFQVGAPSHRWGLEFVPGAVERVLLLLWYAWLVALACGARGRPR